MSNNTILIQRGTLIDPSSDYNRKRVDIFISKGIIETISVSPITNNADVTIDALDTFILPGMFDLRCQLKDPGLEHQEDIVSGAKAAAFSGFTGLAVLPTTEPVVQSKSQIEYIKQIGKTVFADIHPIGAATVDLQSEDITEMFDMRQAGALGFCNGDSGYKSSGTLTRALLYSKEIGGLIMSHPIDMDLAQHASVNESATTIHTGLKQQPDLAETSQIKKEIDIAEYTDAAIHFSHISSSKSVQLIRQAKAEGLKITADVSIWHIIYTDAAILEYDTNYKVTPPFRTESDRKALIEGLLDGTIDAIVSDHNPQNIENKLVEFDYASYGINGLQTFFSAYTQFLSNDISLETLVEKTCFAPRKLLGLVKNKITEKATANLWVADNKSEWTFDKSNNLSKSENNPLFNQKLTGKCVFSVNGKQHLTF